MPRAVGVFGNETDHGAAIRFGVGLDIVLLLCLRIFLTWSFRHLEKAQAMSKGTDWTRTGTVAGYAEWLRAKSDALCVIVVRRDDSVLAADPLLAPADAADRVTEYLPGLVEDLHRARAEKRKAARLELGPVPE